MGVKLTFRPGQPAWVDLGTPDMDSAQRFYGQLLGWTVERSDDPATGGYAVAKVDGDDVAGLGPQQSPGKPYWSVYFATADVDATAAAVKDAGGRMLMAPMDVMQLGRMALFADPEGAAFCVWEPRDHHGADRVEAPGALAWAELGTRDPRAAVAFYTSVFGWCARPSAAGGAYTQLRPSGADRDAIGMLRMGEEFPPDVPAHWLVYFGTQDCDESAAMAKELGATVMVGPADIPGAGRFAILEDPQGAVFALVSSGA
jgi:hypothetical protein